MDGKPRDRWWVEVVRVLGDQIPPPRQAGKEVTTATATTGVLYASSWTVGRQGRPGVERKEMDELQCIGVRGVRKEMNKR